jgi:hypothetical protein
MTTENLPITAADAPKPEPVAPAGPPAGYLNGLDITDEMIDGASWRDKDKLVVARATAREAQRIAAEKVKAESDASSKRAKDAVDALVKKDKETPEDEKPTTDPAKQGYDLTIPEVGADKQQVLNDTVADVSQLGAEAGIDPGELQQLVNVATDFALDEPEGIDYSNIDECVNVLRGIWGEDYDKRVAVVNEQVKQWGPEVEHYLNATGIGNSPGVVRAIYEHATRGKMTGAKAIEAIAKIQGDPKHAYWKGDKKAIAEMRMLQEVSNKHAAKPTGGRTVEGTATTSEIEQAIAAIRANPDYTSLDSRKRKPLVAQMAALQAQIHG